MKKQLIARRVFVNPIFKDKATVLKTTAETGGAYTLGELQVMPGGGNYMHSHSAFEETFTAITGNLGVRLKDEEYYLKPGDSITVPLNTPHFFFNRGKDPVTCHVKFVPGHEGFVKGLSIGYGLAADGKTNKIGVPKNLMHLALLIVLTDTRPSGFYGMLFPAFKWLANIARKKGIERSLLAKYYYE